MTLPDSAVPVEVLREAARAHAERVGLRTAAAEIGLSFSGLRTFLAGTQPYPATAAKLRTWYAAHASVTTEEAAAILARLVSHLPEDRRAAAVRELVERIREQSRAAGVDVPEWVRRVK